MNPIYRLSAGVLMLTGLALAPRASAADLTVTLHGVRAQTGAIRLAVVDSQAGWDGKATPVAGQTITPSGEQMTATIPGLAPGRYAVLVSHDENGNGKLDTNLIGMPTEGYGFSNNPQVMRKPTFDEAGFELGADGATLRIDLR